MPARYNVGEISDFSEGVLWTIPNFSDLPQVHNTFIRSPCFLFENKSWNLILYPNGRNYTFLDWFGIVAVTGIAFPYKCYIHLGIADEQGKSIINCLAESDCNILFRCMKLLSHEEFKSRKDEFMPDGSLHVLFTIVVEPPPPFIPIAFRKELDKNKKCDDASAGSSAQIEQGNENLDNGSKEESSQIDKENKKCDDASAGSSAQIEQGNENPDDGSEEESSEIEEESEKPDDGSEEESSQIDEGSEMSDDDSEEESSQIEEGNEKHDDASEEESSQIDEGSEMSDDGSEEESSLIDEENEKPDDPSKEMSAQIEEGNEKPNDASEEVFAQIEEGNKKRDNASKEVFAQTEERRKKCKQSHDDASKEVCPN